MKKEKCYSVLISVGAITSCEVVFKQYPSTGTLKEVIDEKLETWNSVCSDSVKLVASIKGSDIYINEIKADITINEDIVYNNDSDAENK